MIGVSGVEKNSLMYIRLPASKRTKPTISIVIPIYADALKRIYRL
jgi:hypothetical protein